MDQKLVKEEIRDLSTSIKKQPNPESYLKRGSLYLKLNDDFRSLNDFDKAIELDPKNAEAYYFRGRSYMMGMNPKYATEDFTSAIKLKPDETNYRLDRAMAYKEDEQWKKAIVDFDEYFSKNAPSAEALCEYAFCLWKIGKDDAADQALDRALQIKKDCALAYYYQGIKQHEQNDLAGATEALNRAFVSYTADGDKEMADQMATWIYAMREPAERELRVKTLKNLSLNEQLEALKACGISLKPGVPMSVFERKQAYKDDPFSTLLFDLGGTWKGVPICDQMVGIAAECICNSGDYVRLVEEIKRICGTNLPLTEVDDVVQTADDLDPKIRPRAEISFKLDGKPYRYKLKVDGDYVDEAVFNRIGKLLSQRTKGTFNLYGLSLGGDYAVLGLSPANKEAFEQKTLLKLSQLN